MKKTENKKPSKDAQSFEESIAHVPSEISEEHLREILKNRQSLKEVSLGTRKKQASHLLYLVRYE